MRKLILIPARGGSKGLPRKNILPLAGKPLVCYTLDAARACLDKNDVLCLSTDDEEIREVVEGYGIKVPFLRPTELASDTSSTQEVLIHAINWYKNQGSEFDVVVLLQPTSPLRTSRNIEDALNLWTPDIDMVVSVKETDSNPYYVLFEENESGYLVKSKEGTFTRRQDCPKVYEFNGAVYVISVNSLLTKGMSQFTKMKKSMMTKIESIDIDDNVDFLFAELLIEKSIK